MTRIFLLALILTTLLPGQDLTPWRFHDIASQPTSCRVALTGKDLERTLLDLKVSQAALNNFPNVNWDAGKAAVAIAVNSGAGAVGLNSVIVSGDHLTVYLDSAILPTEVDVIEIDRGQLTQTSTCVIQSRLSLMSLHAMPAPTPLAQPVLLRIGGGSDDIKNTQATVAEAMRETAKQ